jgi:hypothetical protein
MELKVPIGTTIAVTTAIVAALCTGSFFAGRASDPDGGGAAESVEASAHVAEATGDAVEGGIDAALQVDLVEAQAQLAIANMPAASILAQQVADEKCLPATLALAGYSIAVAGSQGKEGSASVNAEEAQLDVTSVITALLSEESPCPAPLVFDIVEADEIGLVVEE